MVHQQDKGNRRTRITKGTGAMVKREYDVNVNVSELFESLSYSEQVKFITYRLSLLQEKDRISVVKEALLRSEIGMLSEI